MRKLAFYFSIFFAFSVVLDMASTVLVFSIPGASKLVFETHPLGYPGCLVSLLVPIPFLLVTYKISKINHVALRVFLTWLLIPLLLQLSMLHVQAALGNFTVYQKIKYQLAGGEES